MSSFSLGSLTIAHHTSFQVYTSLDFLAASPLPALLAKEDDTLTSKFTSKSSSPIAFALGRAQPRSSKSTSTPSMSGEETDEGRCHLYS